MIRSARPTFCVALAGVGVLVFLVTASVAMAARITIVEVENDIVAVGELDPDQIHVPGVYVDRLVRIPPDGIWD